MLETTKLTIRLPRADVAFVKAYARANGLSVTQVIDRHLKRMRAVQQQTPSPKLDAITGIVPSDVAVETEFHKHQLKKHSQ